MTGTAEQTPGWPWPTRADVTRGAERYFQFLQRQVDLNQQIASSWVAAVATTSRATHRDPVAEHAHAGKDTPPDVAEHEPTEPLAEHNLERNDLFDSLVDGLIDADIMATR